MEYGVWAAVSMEWLLSYVHLQDSTRVGVDHGQTCKKNPAALVRKHLSNNLLLQIHTTFI